MRQRVGAGRGLIRLLVRGLAKVKAIALWHALAHNLLRAAALRGGGERVRRENETGQLGALHALRNGLRASRRRGIGRQRRKPKDRGRRTR